MSRNMHKYEELFPEEFEAEKRKSPIVYCVLAPVEYHGRCNALGLDATKGYEIALRAVEITGGIVFPVIPIATVGYNPQKDLRCEREDLAQKCNSPGWYPSVLFSATTCEMVYNEILDIFARDIGFKICVALGTHGSSYSMLKKIHDDNNGMIHEMKLLPVGSFTHNSDFTEQYCKEHDMKIGNAHAGTIETSWHMACNEDYVDFNEFDKACNEKFKDYTKSLKHENEVRKSNIEFGAKIIEITSKNVAKQVLELQMQ
jgi:creatinine amidohydrolase/Fe(II)-dependent formamide hydrolase-like protein